MSFEVKDCIKKLHHSGFIVKDLDRSLRFYQETLKMDLKMRWIETAEQCDIGMCVPGCKLELAQLVGYGAEVELIQFLDAAGTDAPLEPNHIGVRRSGRFCRGLRAAGRSVYSVMNPNGYGLAKFPFKLPRFA